MKHPLVWPVSGFALGILIGSRVPIPFPIILLAAGLATLHSLSRTPSPAPFAGEGWGEGPFTLPAFLLAGWTALLIQITPINPADIRNLNPPSPALVTVQGVLLETPIQKIHGQKPTHSQAVIQLTALRFQNGPWQRSAGKVITSTRGSLDYFRNQWIEISGVLQSPPSALAPGLFDYRAYLKNLNIHYLLRADSPRDWTLISPPSKPPLSDRFIRWAQNAIQYDLPTEDEFLWLEWAMTLGWKTGLTDELSQPFMKAGTMHVFAISGLHIALIATILVSLLHLFQVPRRCCGWIAIPLIWFYTAATGWQASAMRSALMMSIVIIGWMLKRPGSLLNSLAVAALVILTYDPLQLFQASFQLSFLVVLSLALFIPPLQNWWKERIAFDPFLPEEIIPRWRKRLQKILRDAGFALVTIVAAWLGSLPLTAIYFHLFSPASLLANLIVVPLSSLALMANVATILTASWFVAITSLFNHAAWFLMAAMVRISDSIANLPLGTWYVSTPNFLQLAAYLACLGTLLAALNKKIPWRIFFMTTANAAILVTIAAFIPQPIRAYLLSENGAQIGFFDLPGSKNDLLIDCGDDRLNQQLVTPFLHAHGRNRIPTLVLTHGDTHHIGATPSILTEFHPQTIAATLHPSRSPIHRKLVTALEKTPTLFQKLSRGAQLGPWKIFHPDPTHPFPQADDNSLVLHGQIENISILWLSDLGNAGQQSLLQSGLDLKSTIVITGLPSKGQPVNDALLDAIQPELLIVLDSELPFQEKASPALMQRLHSKKFPTLFAHQTGAVTLEITHRAALVKNSNATLWKKTEK